MAHHPPRLAHVFGRYLPISEVFTYEWMRGLTAFEHHVFATSLENLDLFPVPNIAAPGPEEAWWTEAGRRKVDAVVCHFGPQGMLGMPMALALDRPAVTLFHGYDISRLLCDRRWVERYRALFVLGMQALCISEAGRRRLLDIGCPASQATAIHLGVDTTRFAFRAPAERWRPPGPRSVLMVARLVPKKGVDVAVRALGRLRAAGLDLRLRVIGEGPDRQSIERLIAAGGLETQVDLLGALDHARTRAEFDAADLYVQPSVTADSGDQEGIPVSLMEAQASGLPTVSTRHSGIPELVIDGDTGLLVDEHDDEGLAAAVRRLATEPGLAGHLADAARARVEREFDRDRQGARFADYLGALVDDRGKRPSARAPWRQSGERRTLCIRSVPAGLFLRKLVVLAYRDPQTRFSVLTSRTSASILAGHPLIERLYTYEDGRLSLKRIGLATLAHLQAQDFDRIIVPYPDEHGEAFGNVRRCAAAIGARETVALTIRDDERRLPPRRSRHVRCASPEPAGARG